MTLNPALRRPALVLFVLAVALHLWANAGYGIFRDELYYIVCGWHLAWGYMDQPPLSPAIAAASYALFGTWLPGLRIVPALCFAATVALTVQLAKLLGAGRYAAWLAGGTIFAAGVFQVCGVLLTTDPLQPPAWTAITIALVRAVRDDKPRCWLAAGLIAGVAFLGKYSVAFHVGTLGVALLAVPQRRALLAWQPWAAIAIMAAIAAPNLAWQALHGWPFITHAHDLAAHHTEHLSPLAFMAQQVLQMGPLTLLVWGPGLAALLVWPPMRAVRWIGIAYILLMAFGDTSHGKPYYVAPAYPGLIAAGAVALEAWLPQTRRWRTPARTAVFATIIAAAIAGAPLVLPILPPSDLAAYLRAIGLVPGTGEKTQLGALPQYFADMFGWQPLADEVHRIWRMLPPADQARAVFVGRNYGEAAAVDVLAHGPDAISLHQSYWYWGPKGHDGSVVLTMNETRAQLLSVFTTVEQAGRTPPGWGMPSETNQPIWLCRGLRTPITAAWADNMTDN
jgi:4-amino-4-deoxy-L-arabinose transferase-like glycosyltransferase